MSLTSTFVEPRASNERVWQFITTFLAGVIVTAATFYFTNNRDMVTKADLAPIVSSVNSTQAQMTELSRQVGELQGELKAREK